MNSVTYRNIARITIVYIERPTYEDMKLIDIRRIHASVPLSPKIRRFFYNKEIFVLKLLLKDD